MELNKVVRKIQYQVAKLEVIELLLWHGRNNEPSLETEMAYSMFSTLRQNLFNASEVCLDSSLDTSKYIISLQNALVSATNFLIQMNDSLNPEQTQVLFLKNLFDNIISELITLKTELSDMTAQVFQQSSSSKFKDISQIISLGHQEDLPVSVFTEKVDERFKYLLSICMGDIEKAERLISYEQQRSLNLSKSDAIKLAIERWENDNR